MPFKKTQCLLLAGSLLLLSSPKEAPDVSFSSVPLLLGIGSAGRELTWAIKDARWCSALNSLPRKAGFSANGCACIRLPRLEAYL